MRNIRSSKSLSIKLMCCALLITMFSIGLVGCNHEDIGDFEAVLFDGSVAKSYSLKLISASGQKKEELVIPKEINGIPVTGIGSVYTPTFRSPNLKKLFWSGNQTLYNRQIIGDCPELNTIVFTTAWTSHYSEFFTEKYSNAFTSNKRIILLDITKKWLLEDEDYYVPDYIIESPSPNVHYYYNFTSAPNAGYAWIDYIDAGENIKTMPPNPMRKGYEFTGWYLDEKCTQKADLQTVVKSDSNLSFYAGWKEALSE